MNTALRFLLLGGLLAATGAHAADFASPTPLVRAHAHNDYEHSRPLLDALDHGFCSVEADIYLVEGRLLVAHDLDKTHPDRTLQKLYLDPLRDRVKANGGRVFPGGPSLTLLIDFKSDAEQTYRTLSPVLKEYAEMLTAFRPDGTLTGAVTIVISGNRPRETMAGEAVRFAAYDGRLPDLTPSVSVHLVPLISESWANAFKWSGVGPVPSEDQAKLRKLVADTHTQGRRLRFWAIPDRPDAWALLYEAGVDLINTDRLDGLKDFLIAKMKNK